MLKKDDHVTITKDIANFNRSVDHTYVGTCGKIKSIDGSGAMIRITWAPGCKKPQDRGSDIGPYHLDSLELCNCPEPDEE